MARMKQWLDLAVNNTATVKVLTQTNGTAPVFSDLSALGPITVTNLTATGNTLLGDNVADTTGITGATTITSTSASALTVGRQGATAPVLKIDASAATVATGISITGAAAAGGVAIAAISSGTDEALTINAKGTGTIGIGSVSTGAVTITPATNISAATTVTSTSASALTVGRQGATDPVLKIDASAATVVTGISITGAAAAGGVAIAAISSGANEALTINAKGTGTIGIGSVSTGAVTITPATNISAATTITSTSASALTVGRQGATDPVLKIDAATASVATGISITGAAAAGGVAIAAISSGANEALTINAKGSGTIGIGNVSTGAVTITPATNISAATTVTSTSASALTVGRQGATDPVLQIDAATGSVATGIKITGAAAAGGVAIAAISSGTDEALTINAKGTGTIGIGSVSTGAVTITPATTVTGALTPTGGVAAAGGFSVAPRLMHTGGIPAQVSTDGTDATPVNTEVYIAEVFVPANSTLTGVSVFNGSVASGNVKVGLANSSGAVVATSASVAMSGTDAYQRVPFTGTYAAKGPATYYVLYFVDNGTARYNAHTFGDFGAAKQTGQVYATGFTTITPPTTFTTALAPIASLY